MKDKRDLDVEQLWDMFLSYDLFSETELLLITDLNGYSVDTLNDALFVRYGYRDIYQMLDDEDEVYEDA